MTLFHYKVVCVVYDGRARRLLQLVAVSMSMPWHRRIGGGVRRDEEEVAKLLLATADVPPTPIPDYLMLFFKYYEYNSHHLHYKIIVIITTGNGNQ
jgi:hypothetical protein